MSLRSKNSAAIRASPAFLLCSVESAPSFRSFRPFPVLLPEGIKVDPVFSDQCLKCNPAPVINRIDQVYTECPWYGSRRIAAVLRRDKEPVRQAQGLREMFGGLWAVLAASSGDFGSVERVVLAA